MFGNMGNMLKQAQQMQARMEKAQQEIENYETTGEAGGVVKVTMNGKHHVSKVEIADSVFAAGDREMCEDLVLTAINDANRRIEEYSAATMGKVTNGMQLPPGFKLPF